jgi:hypothetical protein
MTTHGWITLFACAGQLALALVVLFRGMRSPLALPLVLLSLDLFFWNFAALAYEISGNLPWRWLDLSSMRSMSSTPPNPEELASV